MCVDIVANLSIRYRRYRDERGKFEVPLHVRVRTTVDVPNCRYEKNLRRVDGNKCTHGRLVAALRTVVVFIE